MPCNDDPDQQTAADRGYSYVSCDMVMYEDGGGGSGDSGGGGRSDSGDDTDANDGFSSSVGSGDDSGGGSSAGSDFADDSSWTTEDASSYAGTASSVISSSSDGGSGGSGGHGNRIKWLKMLWSVIDRMDGGSEHGKGRNDIKRPTRSVKTILRPPTTYMYVTGMSGFPSKVPIYPKRM